MKQDEYQQFQVLWTSVCDVYGKSPSDAAIGMNFRALAKYPLAHVRRALDAHLSDSDGGRFMPKPADLIRHIDGDPESQSLLAWSKVEKHIRTVGPWQTVVFDDPNIMAAIEEMGGWIELCKVTEKELPFKRNEFAKRYKGYQLRPPEHYPNRLTGASEAHNARIKSDVKTDPVLIGDPELCQQIYLNAPGKSSGPVRLSQITDKLQLEQKDAD
jgi:hypothetical protein